MVRPPPAPELASSRVAAESSRPPPRDTIYAVEEIRRMHGGSQSHLMRCSDGNYYVVKFQNNPQHRRILVNEMLGTKLAALLGLPTTAVAIIEVSKELIRLTPCLRMEMQWTHIPCQPGLQFGSRYPGDPHILAVLDLLPDSKVLIADNLKDFLGMLVFDMWTCNTDGRQVIYGRHDLGAPYQAWMIDQGFCFNSGEWNFPDSARRSLHARNVVYRQARGIECFEPWLVKLESEIGLQVLWDIAKTIPPEWYKSDSGALRRLLEQLDARRCKVRELLFESRRASPNIFSNWTEQDRTQGESEHASENTPTHSRGDQLGACSRPY